MRHLNRHPVRRAAVGVLAGTVALTGGALIVGVSPANALEGFAFDRLAGENRWETAKEIAEDGWLATDTPQGAGADTVILASGATRNFPDALTGNYLAGSLEAPILLTRPSDLPAHTATALENLGTENVVIVGGTDAVSQAVEDGLTADGYTVTRIGGADRYDTARDVAIEVGDSGANVGDANVATNTAILGFGQNFPDILAAGPLSYAGDLPITITQQNTLPEQTKTVLEDLNIEHVIIVGGTDVISESVKDEVEAIVGVGDTLRLDGPDGLQQQRYQTAIDIADFAYNELGFDASHINLARSDDFADALTGGPHGGEELAPIVITLPNELHPDVEDFLTSLACTLADGHIFGGTDAINQTTEDAAVAAASDVSACLMITDASVGTDLADSDGATNTASEGDVIDVAIATDTPIATDGAVATDAAGATITARDANGNTVLIECGADPDATEDGVAAADCEVSEDGLTLTITLLEDAVDANGTILEYPLTFSDVSGLFNPDGDEYTGVGGDREVEVATP